MSTDVISALSVDEAAALWPGADQAPTPDAARRRFVRGWAEANNRRAERNQPSLRRMKVGLRYYYTSESINEALKALEE